jgi:DNA-binding CsgD family transcriptional regulator
MTRPSATKTPALTHDEHIEVLSCIQALYGCRSLAAFPEHALRALAALVPSTLSAFNEVNLRRGRTHMIMDRPIDHPDRIVADWERYRDQHPLVRYVEETGDGQAVKISDFLGEMEYHRLDIYRTVYAPLRAEDQMSITIRSDGGIIIAIAINRSRRDFSESDRVKLNLVRPHLLQAYANVEELAGYVEEKEDLRTALRESGHGLIALDDDGVVIHETPGVGDCLARHFPDVEPLPRLPPALADWLTTGATDAFMLYGTRTTLIVRSPRDTERRLLLVSEAHAAPAREGERLTPRETEVLRWLVQGKSNGEIATILGIAPGTAKQHVQRILAKLGVANRTAATALARDRGFD